MESKDWTFAQSIDRGFFNDHHDQVVECVSLSLRQRMADHIFNLLLQDDAICIQRSGMTIRDDDRLMTVSLRETLRAQTLILCKDCKFWDAPPSCEGLARCMTGESGIRFRKAYDFCSSGRKKMDGGGDDVVD